MHIFTVTTNGYRQYTKNLLMSMQNIGMTEDLHIYCLDEKSFEFFKDYKNTHLEQHRSSFDTDKHFVYLAEDFVDMGYYRYKIADRLLKEGQKILYIDGDIVVLKDPKIYFDSFTGHIAFQNDFMDEGGLANLCTGFFYLNPSEESLRFCNYDNIINSMHNCRNKGIGKWAHNCADQDIINLIKPGYNITSLPLRLFPNGQYYYTHQASLGDDPYIIHFNWVMGGEKMNRMKHYGYWFVD